MVDRHAVVCAIHEAVDEVNTMLPRDQRIPKTPHSELFGPAGILDSIGVVNLVVAVEQKIEARFGHAVSLTDESAISESINPIGSLGVLVDFVTRRLAELRTPIPEAGTTSNESV